MKIIYIRQQTIKMLKIEEKQVSKMLVQIDRNSDNECHLDEDKSNHLEDENTYEKDCSKNNEALQQLLNLLKENYKKIKI